MPDHCAVLLHIIRTGAAGEVVWGVFADTFHDYYHFFAPPDLDCDGRVAELLDAVNELLDWTAPDPSPDEVALGWRTEERALVELRNLLRAVDASA